MARVELEVTHNTGRELHSKIQEVPFHPSELGSAWPSSAFTDPRFESAGIVDQRPPGSACVQSDLCPSKRLHGKVLGGRFSTKPFPGALSATENICCPSFMKDTYHNGSECQMSLCALLQTKIIAPYTQIKGARKAAQPMTQIQQFHRAFFLAFSLPGHFLDLYTHSVPSAFSSVTEKNVQTKLDDQGDVVEQSLPGQLAISSWILLNLWMAL